ncbi:MAG: 2-oxo acid dehydrogenase subunit E2, partial [Acidobacteriota bacterium]|nr:2-oxo acid dehydrogenase subunit E2 [Acidobacteriota bacterium]
MIKEVRLPEIAENVETGDVIKVMVKVGDVVDVDQPLVELETEKAVLEVPSPHKGKIAELLVKEGDTIEINQIIVKIDTEDLESDAPASDSTEEESADRDGGKAESDSTEQESADRGEAEPAGDEDASRGDEKPAPRPTGDAKPENAAQPVATMEAEEPEPAKDAAPASPALRRLARELGVDISRVRGSGPGGRIQKEDVTEYARDVVSGVSTSGPAAEVTEKTKWGPVVREPMSKVRQVTARSMTAAWTTVPHVTQYDKADITDIDALRKRYGKKLEKTGDKLTMTAIILKVAAAALKVFPQFNASVDMKAQEIIYKRFYHVGVAVDTDRGLLVPVIRSVDKKNIVALSRELNDLAERARNKKVTPDEMEGGTFTVSNL